MLIGSIIIVILIVLDQVIKILSVYFKNSSNSLIKVLIPEVLEFHYIENTGASFGMLKDQHLIFGLITVLALVIFGYLFVSINFKTKKVYTISVILFIAGTYGNAIDRVFRNGVVIDMFNMPVLNNILSLIGISPFIFNLADVFLNFGIILFIIDMLFFERKRIDSNE